MDKIKRKLIMAGLSLTVAVVMMVTASMAWMTISTSPEVSGMEVTLYTKRSLLSSDNGEDFVQYLDLSQAFRNLAPLQPTSTVDGIRWFGPTYNPVVNPKDEDQTDNGALSGFVQLTDENANVSIVDDKGRPLTGDAWREAVDKSYYVYTDFWLKTEEEGCNVRLSVPRDPKNLDAEETTGANGGKYGSYVLAGREYMKVNDTVANRVTSKAAESCVRVGFLIDPDNDSETYATEFYIYEPNADQRSSDSEEKPTDTYVFGYTLDKDSYTGSNYIKTNPIGIQGSTIRELPLEPEKLIIQKKSAWGAGAEAVFKNGRLPGSNEVDTFGKYLSADTIYSESSTAVSTAELETDIASQVILTLEQEKPVMVRMFIWLEGQDVDCWNDIAAGSFIVNLELSGESIVPTETDNAEEE